MYLFGKLGVAQSPISEKLGFIGHSPKICVEENMLNIPAHAVAPCQKYIRDWVLCCA